MDKTQDEFDLVTQSFNTLFDNDLTKAKRLTKKISPNDFVHFLTIIQDLLKKDRV